MKGLNISSAAVLILNEGFVNERELQIWVVGKLGIQAQSEMRTEVPVEM
jgi:hypothetical protein